MINKLTVEIQKNLLCSALEGGSNYWYMITDYNESGSKYVSDKPFEDGGYLTITDGEITKTLTKVDFKIAGELMLENHIKHFSDAINETDDAVTGDVFLQLAMFGEVIYA